MHRLVEVVDVEGQLDTGHDRPPLCVTYIELTCRRQAAHLFDICQYRGQDRCHAEGVARDRHVRPVCCAPVAAGPVDDAAALEVAMRLKAFADPARVKIDVTAAQRGPGRRPAAIWPRWST